MIIIFTDGSYDSKYNLGYWVSILYFNYNKQITLSGKERNVKINSLELISVIESIKHLKDNYPDEKEVKIITDSQYVFEMPNRLPLLIQSNFMTSKGTEFPNINLLKEFYNLLKSDIKINFEKVKAHQKTDKGFESHFNRMVDKKARKLLRINRETLKDIL